MALTSAATEADGLIQFVNDSPTPYHACRSAAAMLEAAGFSQVDEAASWPPGGQHYLSRGGSLVAWASPDELPQGGGFRLVGAHTDSPNLRVRPIPDSNEAGYRQLRMEVYGGPLLNSWLDRDLGLAGRVAVAGGPRPELRLLRIDRPLLRIPQLAPHLDASLRSEGLRLNPQTQMTPIWGMEREGAIGFRELLAQELAVEVERVISWEMMTYDLAPATRAGGDREFISAARLDNLGSSYAATRALVEHASRHPEGAPIAVICLFDFEEIGSRASTGADSAWLSRVLERIVLARGAGREEFLRDLAGSLCVSADTTTGLDPNYLDRHDPGHRPLLNGGPAIKAHASQRYSTSAPGTAAFVAACETTGVPWQSYSRRADVPGGGTIGPIVAAQLGVETVDVGMTALALHSCRELCGAEDPALLTRALAAFLAS
ncbi:MAG: M18 family aminopeptidase [Candidatus Dormibacteria bacterium]